MCKWCCSENNKIAKYDIPTRGKHGLAIEGDQIVVYHFIDDYKKADMALVLPIRYCPMCGRQFWDDDDNDDEGENYDED